MNYKIPIALTIAGSDSGGGAGIQADLKTFTAHCVYGASVITSVTAQNTMSVNGILNVEPKFVALQIDSVMEDIGADAVKTGMLANEAIVNAVSDKLREYGIDKLVVDPVMISKAGDPLLEKEAEKALIQNLLPLAYIITPNIPEAEVITGLKIHSIETMQKCCELIKSMGPKYVLIKGGHIDWSNETTDILYDGVKHISFTSQRIDTKNTHGTGCTYSASICALLARGLNVVKAVEQSKKYVAEAIARSFNIGKGYGPLNHFWMYETPKEDAQDG